VTDDLVRCLRNRANGFMQWVTVEQMATEAADRIEALETALRRIACDGEPYDKCHCVNSEGCSYGIARAALGEKKDD